MNGRQRRKLHRIWLQKQKGREPNATALRFVKDHAPPPKHICVMSDADSKRFHDVSIGHRCTATTHRHYTRKHVEILVDRGEAVWVGGHRKIAAWAQHKTWAKVDSGGFSVMQLVEGLRR